MRPPIYFVAAGAVLGLASFAYHCSSDPPPLGRTEWTLADYGPGRCFAVNAGGDAVGIAHDNTPFAVRGGVRTDLPAFDGAVTVPLAIGDDGTIVGYAQTNDGRVPIRFVDGGWRALEGIPFGVALGISGSRIVGYTQSGPPRAFAWSNGAVETLAVPADRMSLANTATGDVVAGSLHAPGGATHAFVIRNGALTDLGTLGGGKGSSALAANARGDVVGNSEVGDGTTRGFVSLASSGGTLTEIVLPFGATSSDARGIDVNGRVAANANDGPVSHPFVIPPPAPEGVDAGESDGGAGVIDLLPAPDGGPKVFVTAHAASMASNGRIAGWVVPFSEEKSELRCAVWSPPEVSQ